MRKQSGIDALIATSATSGARRLFDRATALLTAQSTCVDAEVEILVAERKQGSRPVVVTLGSNSDMTR